VVLWSRAWGQAQGGGSVLQEEEGALCVREAERRIKYVRMVVLVVIASHHRDAVFIQYRAACIIACLLVRALSRGAACGSSPKLTSAAPSGTVPYLSIIMDCVHLPSIRSISKFSPNPICELIVQLYTLNRLLASAPVAVHRFLDLDAAITDVYANAHHVPPVLFSSDIQKNLQGIFSEHRLDQLDGLRANGIPAAYVEAYTAALQRRVYVNRICFPAASPLLYSECTFSEAIAALPAIDQLLGTTLRARFDAVFSALDPFPFLRLPAELRLLVCGT